MAETVLINAATVASGDPTTVVAHQMLVPGVQFRVVCDNTYTAKFYVADVDFNNIANAAELAGTSDSHAATTGIVYDVDPGAYDYVACVVTNTGPDAATITVAVGYDLVAEAPSALFTVAEARAFNDAILASVVDYPNVEIIAFEAAFREWFTEAAGLEFLPTVHTDEVRSGDGTPTLLMGSSKITSVTAASIRSGTTWTALTVAELAAVVIDPECDSILYREGGCWPWGVGNIKVSYVAGYADVPDLVKEAALTAAVAEIPVSQVPYEATGYDAGGGAYSWDRADGYNQNWSKLPVVMRALRLYGRSVPGLA